MGPASAPVTLVEYSDLECPVCARMQEELEKEIIPKYGDKLRVVFKEYPLVAIHDWAMTAAVAAQCVYELEPSKYFDFRSTVYKNQATVNADNARDMLLHYAAEAECRTPNSPLASMPRLPFRRLKPTCRKPMPWESPKLPRSLSTDASLSALFPPRMWRRSSMKRSTMANSWGEGLPRVLRQIAVGWAMLRQG